MHRSMSFPATFTLGTAVLVCAAVGSAAAPSAEAPGFQVLQRACFNCHSGPAALSGLDLSSLAGALKGGKHGPALTPGKPDASRLVQMVHGKKMPPTSALPDRDVAILKAWVLQGAPYPIAKSDSQSQAWWAFRAPVPVKPPNLKESWVRNPIDAFLLARMRGAGIRPNVAADRLTLIRRVTFDLHGLPPTPEEVDAFVNDRRPDAYERVVERLLASPRYAERQARHWLDLARFAESEGFKADETRPNAWRYRDYVIESFHADKPYDRFVREQIAGDELYPGDHQALVATGFNRHWADESNARNIALRRQEILNDITDTVGSVMLGLTLGCARCHDHKYDAITHRDYYRIQAFFAAAQPRDDLVLAPESEQRRYRTEMDAWLKSTERVRSRLALVEQPVRTRLMVTKRMPFTPEVQDAIDTPAQQRTALQWQLFNKVAPQLDIKDDELGKAMKGEEKATWESLRSELKASEPGKPADLPKAIGVVDIGTEAPKVHVLSIGVYDQPLEEVEPGFIAAVDARTPRIVSPGGGRSTGRRSVLANWIASPENPLTARVMVNRVWQQHFGLGLVASSSDFGRAGEPPTHPELLDWLARRFAAPKSEGGMAWSLKRLHQLMVTANAYRQSSAHQAAAAARDPQNKLVWRYRRWRLEGEAIRDSALLACGELNDRRGGPSVFPELPSGVVTRGGWNVTPDEAERKRRSVYVFVRRNLRYPLFEAFDYPDTHEPCARRSVTNTAPQALMMFNSELSVRFARHLAGRVIREADTPDARLERAYRLAFGRRPETAERDEARAFLGKQQEILMRRKAAGRPIEAPVGIAGFDPVGGAAWVDLCHALINANEFVYVD